MSFDDRIKDKIRNSTQWREYTNVFDAEVYSGGSYWMRACPKPKVNAAPQPYLIRAGRDSGRTYPDGMYVRLSSDLSWCDAVIIEACGSPQNFGDKRSRYGASTQANTVQVGGRWLLTNIKFKNGNITRKDVCGVIHQTTKSDRFSIPVRGISVLYVIEDNLYDNYRNDYFPEPNEYFISYADFLKDNNSISIFLRRLDLSSRFYR